MSKKSKYESDIELKLKKSSQNLKGLYYEVTGIKKLYSSDHAFFEALMDLIKENKIIISGYDFNVHKTKGDRIQSFMKEGIILEWVTETFQTENFAKLNQMDDFPDPENVKQAKSELLKIFIKKFRQIEQNEKNFYDQISKKVISEPFDNWIKDCEKELEEIKSQPDNDSEHSLLIRSMQHKIKAYRKQLDECPNSVIWKLEDLIPNDYDKIFDFNRKSELTTRETSLKDTLTYPFLDHNDSTTKIQFLEKKGIYKPVFSKSADGINKIFNRVLFFVNNHDNYKFMRQNFALALSDEKDSIEFFKLFIDNATPSLKKLENELGINNKTDDQQVINKIDREELVKQMESM